MPIAFECPATIHFCPEQLGANPSFIGAATNR